MGFFDSFFGNSSRLREREWYGHASSSSHRTASRQGYSAYEPSPSCQNARHSPYSSTKPRRYRGEPLEPYYNYTRDDRRYSFGRRQARNEQVHFRQPEVDHCDYYSNRVPETARAHYSRDPYNSRNPKPYVPSSHRTAQRERERDYHYGVQGYGARYGGGFGGHGGGGFGGGFGPSGYQDRSTASYLQMDGRYPRYR